ncbi:DUF1206 domain-containing protein [Streptomyces sp. RKND-216]|uniref:DUF1206 domain-containing protein n=1 Tax=Streptomyces sp. RKND-216 TaxID=2562581 RepID=UPI00109DCF78|nr:DUF1206 domain-containing protein [Streptomyces sp. RKND-216]THA26648.1 DUF1206 domain-containing protein [Streptomyces sp. RKND-216]
MNTFSTARRSRRSARRSARQAKNSTAMKGAARWGFAARGLIYLLVGVLALQIAFGDSGEQADRGGALQAIAQRPLGSAVIWALGIGLAGMALWRLSEAVVGATGKDGRKTSKRLQSAARFVLYAVIAASVLAYAAGDRSGSQSSDKQSQDVTARVMEMPAGPWLVGLVGAGLVGAGLWIGLRAVQRKYHEHLRVSGMSRRTRKVVDVLGVVGGVCRGAVFAVAGGFLVKAAFSFDPDKAKGVDDTLRTFAETPAGLWLLAAVAAGLVLFGLFSFAMARWRKV